MPSYSDTSADFPAALARLLAPNKSHDKAADRDAATPEDWAAAHAEHYINEIRAVQLYVQGVTGLQVTDGGGLDVDYSAGRIRVDTGAPVDVAASSLTLTDDDTNYVECDSAGTVSDNVVGFTAGAFPLATVVTSGGDITGGPTDDRTAYQLITGAGLDLDDLANVVITAVADNELLAYDSGSSKWINQTPAEANLVTLSADETITGQKTFTKAPAGTGVGDGPLYINPASANADETLFGVALSGSSRFRVDEDGDVLAVGNVIANRLYFGGDMDTAHLSEYGTWAAMVVSESSGFMFSGCTGNTPGRARLWMGPGVQAQISLGLANLDQNDVLIKRDVDGASSWSEAGALLTLQRDVTNVTAENGHFWEAQNAAGTILAQLDKDGSATFGDLTVAGQGYVHIKGDDDADDDPGCLVLYDHDGTPYYLWVDRTGDLRIHTAAPADEDADGTVVGAQS